MRLRRITWLAVVGLASAVAAHGEPVPRKSADPAVARGSAVFGTYCVLCHGADATGNGSAAKLYAPGPANLTVSPYSDDYKALIIRDGGLAMGRSEFMPPWGRQLSEGQIKDVVVFLRTVVKQDERRIGSVSP